MADRNTPAAATFEEWRVEFNELATDVGDIANITSATGTIAPATDVIDAVVLLNTGITGLSNEVDFPDSTGVNVARIKLGTDDDLQMYHNGSNSIIEHSGTGNLQLTNNSTTLTFPNTGGTIATEGFSIAVSIALG